MYVILSILTAFVVSIPIGIINLMFRNRITKYFAVLIVIGLMGLLYFITITNIALLG